MLADGKPMSGLMASGSMDNTVKVLDLFILILF